MTAYETIEELISAQQLDTPGFKWAKALAEINSINPKEVFSVDEIRLAYGLRSPSKESQAK